MSSKTLPELISKVKNIHSKYSKMPGNICSVFSMSVIVLQNKKTLLILTFNYLLHTAETKIKTIGVELLAQGDSLLFQFDDSQLTKSPNGIQNQDHPQHLLHV